VKGQDMAAMESMRSPGMRFYIAVWIVLLLIVGVEVALTYARLPFGTLLAGLLALAILEAAIGVLYFMHLRYERPLLFWTLIPGLVFVLLMMNQLWPDAYRLLSLHP
jgi:cytochrome c oxidase subunit IV